MTRCSDHKNGHKSPPLPPTFFAMGSCSSSQEAVGSAPPSHESGLDLFWQQDTVELTTHQQEPCVYPPLSEPCAEARGRRTGWPAGGGVPHGLTSCFSADGIGQAWERGRPRAACPTDHRRHLGIAAKSPQPGPADSDPQSKEERLSF